MKTAKKPKPLNLYLNCMSDYSIVDDARKVYTVDEARALWEAGKVADSNLALTRLARMGWDIEALKAWFDEADRARGSH